MKNDALESYRCAAIELLTEAYTADTLDMEEFERRTTLVHNAMTAAAIQDALADIPTAAGPEEPMGEPATQEVGDSGSPQVISVLSERKYRGDWLEGGRGSALTVLGATRLDLRETALDQGIVSLHVVAIMGETRIVIPQDMRVENNISAVLAEVSINAPRSRDRKQRTLRLSGFALMGEIRVDVKGI